MKLKEKNKAHIRLMDDERILQYSIVLRHITEEQQQSNKDFIDLLKSKTNVNQDEIRQYKEMSRMVRYWKKTLSFVENEKNSRCTNLIIH